MNTFWTFRDHRVLTFIIHTAESTLGYFKWICMIFACFSSVLFAGQKQQVQHQLLEVKNKMGQVERSITETIHRRQTLHSSLEKTEKTIGQEVLALHIANQNVQKKKQEIEQIANHLNELNRQLDEKQQALRTHLRMRYQMGEAQPVQWLLNQEKLKNVGRLITYYHYIIQTDKKLIHGIRTTQQEIALNKQKLDSELLAQKNLQQKILQHQQQLTEEKKQHQKLMLTLTQLIENKQQTLINYKQSQAKLQTLIDQLSRVAPVNHSPTLSRLPTSSPSTLATLELKGKFSNPLQGSRHQGKALNQGMLFVAPEGTAVNAILPGKVVFSDWLNGYGLLLIVDHGNGMMSLYAHNESLFKSRGNSVKAGEQIATVGHTGGIRENGLYFELRRRGKAVPPRQWLA